METPGEVLCGFGVARGLRASSRWAGRVQRLREFKEWRTAAVRFLMLALAVVAWEGARTAAVASEALARPGGRETLGVVTYNLRYASEKPPNAWPQRRPVMAASIRTMNPDVMGTQEGLYPQLKDLAGDLPAYEWIGLGRDGGSRGEWMAVFYRRERLEPLEFDHFWLSDTPNVIGSSTWGNSNRRMVTWVRFKDRVTGRELYFMNTHLDHQIQAAREKSAALILERVRALSKPLPVILVGDFNATAGRNPAYATLVNPEGFSDTWSTATERRGPVVKTFHGFTGPVAGDDRIDWILSRGLVRALATEIVTYAEGGQYPSDHFPVAAWLDVGE